jgi:transposase
MLCYVGFIGCPTDSSNLEQLLESVTLDEQRAWIKIQVLRGCPASQIYSNLTECLGSITFSRSHVYDLVHQFREGLRVESCHRPREGRPRTATNQDMQERLVELVEELDSPRTEDLALRLDISHTSVETMLHNMGYRFLNARWIPHELSRSQKEKRVATARSNLVRYRNDPTILERIIAIDETWLYSYQPLVGPQARSWVRAGERP